MNDHFLYYIGILIVIAAALWIFFTRRPKRRPSVQNDYIAGLQYLIWGDNERALQKLRDVVRRDTDYIDAYILIGNIFRERGAYESAVKVHRDLLLRPNLAVEQQKTILMNLAQDYYKNGQLKWALATCDKLIELDKKDDWPKEFKLTIYEAMGDWEGAFEILRRLPRMDKAERMSRLALYKVEQGLQLTALNREHDARLCFREAIKWDTACYPARLELIKSYFRENRNDDALTELHSLLAVVPEFADVTLNAFEHRIFEIGRFDEIEQLYRQVVGNHPHLVEAQLNLAALYEKKGQFSQAFDLLRHAQTHDPENERVCLMLLRLELKMEQYEDAARRLDRLVDEELKRKNRFRCTNCGAAQEEYFWRCPACKSWNSAARR